MCLFKGIQHSAPYNNIDSTQAWYTFLLVFKVKLLSLKTVFFKAPKAWDALIIHLSTSASILPEAAIRDPSYENSSTQHKSPPSTDIDSLSLSTLILPETICLVLGALTVSPKLLQVL